MIYLNPVYFDADDDIPIEALQTPCKTGHMVVIKGVLDHPIMKACVRLPNQQTYEIYTLVVDQTAIYQLKKRSLTKADIRELQLILMGASLSGENANKGLLSVQCPAKSIDTENLNYWGRLPLTPRFEIVLPQQWSEGLAVEDLQLKQEMSGNRMTLDNGIKLFFWSTDNYDKIDPLHLALIDGQPHQLHAEQLKRLQELCVERIKHPPPKPNSTSERDWTQPRVVVRYQSC